MINVMALREWKQILFRSDVVVSLSIVMILTIMIIPLPPMLLDIMLSMSISSGLLILITSLYIIKPLDFSIFPSILLASTLFRLSLNVASTRLILLHGDEGPNAAGHVIQAFGQFVVGGNYVVGVVVFIILVVINFMVITKGAGRIAEVSARFTLDAMPGKQMAIDADLNTGLIDEPEARFRRDEIRREADFHGAMDGASKFVRGDAIAGIIITIINIVAGIIIGIFQKGMPAGEAAATYTILTVGDGLVSQIPALVISTASGLLVTRTAESEGFGAEIKKPFILHPQAMWVVSGILFGFSLIPGLPFIPFFFISVFLAFIAYQIEKDAAALPPAPVEEPQKALPMEQEDYTEMLAIDLLELEVGYGLIAFVDSAQDGELLNRIHSIRKQFALESGFIVPPIHIKDNLELNPNEYSISLKGVKIGGGEVLPGHFLAMDPGTATEKIKGIATEEPAFGLPATWISEDKKERAQLSGHTVVDCTTVMATHISEIIRRNAHELLGRQEAQNLLDNIAKSYPKLVEELIPEQVNLGTVMRVLQNLLREDISIRDLRTIMETMADFAGSTRDPDQLTEYVRQALARQICSKYTQDGQVLPLLTFNRTAEETIQQSIQQRQDGSTYLVIDPQKAKALLDGLTESISKLSGGLQPVLLCTPSIRPHVKKLTERFLPSLVVLSHNEIAPQLKVRSIGTVSLNAG